MMASLSGTSGCKRIDAFLGRLTLIKGKGATRRGDGRGDGASSAGKSLTKAASSGTILTSVGRSAAW